MDETDRPRLNEELLTTREVAAFLRLKERKVYDLVALGQIPHIRATGKLLFPRERIHAWLMQHSEQARGMPAARDWPLICAGSHDPLLEWALGESRAGIATFCDGSLDGLDRLARGEAMMAGLHLLAADGSFNASQARAALGGQPVVLIEFTWRQQGLIVPPGNPAGFRRMEDLAGRRFAARQPEAGSFVLLQHLLKQAGLTMEALDLLPEPARSEMEVALAVASGRADAGLGLAALARQLGLGFVPLANERYDIVIWRRAYFDPPFQRFLAFCRSEKFIARAHDLEGYDVQGLGEVRYNGP